MNILIKVITSRCDSCQWNEFSIYMYSKIYLAFHISLSIFFAIIILILVISNCNLLDMCQRFFYVQCSQNRNFSWIRHKVETLPIDPHCKRWPLWTTSCIHLYCISENSNWKVSDHIKTLTHTLHKHWRCLDPSGWTRGH